jgi:hypothetical protein
MIKTKAQQKEMGTYDKRSDSQSLATIAETLPVTTKIEAPAFLKDDRLKDLWTITTNRLLVWQILSDVDIELLRQGFFLLQELEKQEKALSKLKSAGTPKYASLIKTYKNTLGMIDLIFGKYGFTPKDRSNLKLTATQIKEKETLLEKISKNALCNVTEE